MPKGGYLSRIFSASPLHELQQHMEQVLECCDGLNPLFAAVARGDSEAVGEAQQRIHKLENDADISKKNIRLHLPRSLFLPVDRSDVLELLRLQDHLANTAQDIAGVLVGRQMTLPPASIELFLKFVDSAVRATVQARQTVAEVNELFESGFRGAEVEIMEGMIEKLNQLEFETDEVEVRLRAAIFLIEKDLPPVDTMFLYRIIDWISDLADTAQSIGSRLQLLMDR